MDMARLKKIPCKYYICRGKCEKGKKAAHNRICQKCSSYEPRSRKYPIDRNKVKYKRPRIIEVIKEYNWQLE